MFGRLFVGSDVGVGHTTCPNFALKFTGDLASAVIFCWWAQEFVTLPFSTGIYSEFESCCEKRLKVPSFAHFSHVKFVNTQQD